MNNLSDTDESTTHFGFRQVPLQEKAGRVADVFHSVADRYDVMNDLMSLGMHRLWKREAIAWANIRPGNRVLDLASGTGDLAALMVPKVGAKGSVTMSDINPSMLKRGWARMTDAGHVSNVDYAIADAENLPFPDSYFDRVTMAFGLRNVTRKENALKEMYRVLKPGGAVLVLEFSQPVIEPLRPVYDAYSFNVLPKLGQLIANDAESYRYLAESIRMHPNQDALASMMEAAGFGMVSYRNMTVGIVAMHRGYHL